MPTQKVLIGNIKGPTGDTGPANASTGTKVEWQLSDSGTTPPTGAWTAEVPSPEQGRYLWSKVTVSWTEGEASVSYGVTYQGRDGDTVAEERLKALEDRLDALGDPVAVEHGGTGAKEAATALTNLEIHVLTNEEIDAMFTSAAAADEEDGDMGPLEMEAYDG